MTSPVRPGESTIHCVRGGGAYAPTALPDYIKPAFRSPIQAWLSAHPGYRLATIEDCRCKDDIDDVRHGGGAWQPQPNYQPYYAQGDFDADGLQDIAVIALSQQSEPKLVALIVFGGKAGAKTQVVEIPQSGSDVASRGLFVRQAAKGSHSRLLFGAFGSEADEIVIHRQRASKK